MDDIASIRWRLFVAWLSAGLLPAPLCCALEPVAQVLPLARQNAAAVSSWLLALLAERRRRPAAPALSLDGAVLPLRPLEAGEVQPHVPWLLRELKAELVRLVALAVAPGPALAYCQPGWLEWEARYWALAVTLARLGQLYHSLERQQGSQPAQRLLAEVAGHVGQQVLEAA